MNAIYAQTLDLSITNLDESAAVTLMSSDVERICDAMLPIHSIWSSPLEVGLAIWLLQREIGLALLGPMFITAVAISGPFIIGKYIGAAQMTWMEKIQARIGATSKMLDAMKGVKMLGFGSKISSIITKLRLEEIAKSLKMRKLFVVMIAFGNLSDIFATGAAFAVFVIVATVNGQVLDVTNAFTALSLIALLDSPIRSLVFSTPPLMAAVGCFDRIEKYLSSPTKRDHRLLLPQARGPLTGKSTMNTSTRHLMTDSDVEMDDIRPQTYHSLSQATIRVENLTLAWSTEDNATESNPVISDVSLDFQPGKLTMIVGPVGCGKSSLLKGLLGETPSAKGNVFIDRDHASFVDQTSWIQNASIRNNIIGVSNFDAEWYNTVVHACAIDKDLENLPDGDGTNTGSAGGALSGGQKLRVVCETAS